MRSIMPLQLASAAMSMQSQSSYALQAAEGVYRPPAYLGNGQSMRIARQVLCHLQRPHV